MTDVVMVPTEGGGWTPEPPLDPEWSDLEKDGARAMGAGRL